MNSNKKIFIIHGWTYSLSAWDALKKYLEDTGYEIVMLHVPGLTQESQEVWDLDKYVAWLHERLLNEQDVILIGHSNGGRIALKFATQYPDKLSKLILIDAAGIRHNEFSLRIKRLVFGTVAKIGKSITSSQTARKIFYKIIRVKDYEKAPENMRKTMQNLLAEDLAPELSKITTQTLIIWGNKDAATPVSDAHIMHEKIKNSKLVVLENTGHSPHMTQTEKVGQEIRGWLNL